MTISTTSVNGDKWLKKIIEKNIQLLIQDRRKNTYVLFFSGRMKVRIHATPLFKAAVVQPLPLLIPRKQTTRGEVIYTKTINRIADDGCEFFRLSLFHQVAFFFSLGSFSICVCVSVCVCGWLPPPPHVKVMVVFYSFSVNVVKSFGFPVAYFFARCIMFYEVEGSFSRFYPCNDEKT